MDGWDVEFVPDGTGQHPRVARLAAVVEFLQEGVGEPVGERPEAGIAGPLRSVGGLVGDAAHDVGVDLHGHGGAGTLHLDDHRGAVGKGRRVDLREGGGGERRLVHVQVRAPDAELGVDDLCDLRPRDGRGMRLQPGEFLGEARRDDVRAGGEDLSHLHEGDPRLLHRRHEFGVALRRAEGSWVAAQRGAQTPAREQAHHLQVAAGAAAAREGVA